MVSVGIPRSAAGASQSADTVTVVAPIREAVGPADAPNSCGESRLAHVTARWRPEQPRIIARELGHAFIADPMSCMGNSPVFHQHQPPRFDEPQLLLELERRERGDGSEMLMEGGFAHPCQGRKIPDAQRAGIVLADQRHSPGNAMGVGIGTAK